MRIAGAVLAVGLCVAGCKAAAMDDATVRRLTEQGVDPDSIYLVELPGFTAVEKSIKPTGDGGFSMTYVSDSDPADHAEFRTHPADFTEEMCPSTPIPNADGTLPIKCAPNPKGWYRSSGEFHEYVRAAQGHIRLSAPIDVLSHSDMIRSLTRSESLWGPASRS